MVTAQEFATGFYSLGGITPGEQRKQLHVLLHRTKESSGTDVVDFSAVKPRTILEQNFKIEALIYFQRFRELLDVLKCENPIPIHKVLKTGSWFVKEVIKSITGEELVTKIFPFTSLNVKEKLLTQLAIHFDDPHKADEYFYAIKRTYGLYLAQRLLSACSDALILQHIKENKTEVTPRQLSTILDHYPQHTETIFAYLNSHEAELAVGNKYRSVFIKLAKTCDTLTFLKIYKKYNPNIQLGPRGTRAFISKTKQDVIDNPSKYHKLLSRKRIGRSLTNDFPKFYLNFFPKSISRLKNTMQTLLGLLRHIQSNPEKLHLILETFQKVYGTELWEYSDLVTPELIEMMSPDERELWMTVHKKPQDITEEMWISYMKTDKSIPILKSKIAITSKITTRTLLIGALVKTCKINNDKTALAEVCKYVFATHRNDNVKIGEEFFTTLVNGFDLTKLEDAQWTVLLECVGPFKAIKCQSFFNRIEEHYIYYRLRKGLPIDDQLQQWAKDMESSKYDICTENPKFAKECLIQLSKYIPVDGSNKETAKSSCYNYLKAIKAWNTQYHYDRISLFTNSAAIDFMKEDLQEQPESRYFYTCTSIVVNCIIHEYEQSEQTGLIHLMLNRKAGNFYRSPVICWLLRNKPQVLTAYADLIVDILIYYPGTLYRRFINMSIREKIIADSYGVIEKMSRDFSGIWLTKNALILLSLVESPKEFLKFVEKYHPTELGPDLATNEGKLHYKMQQMIFGCIHNIYPVTDTLDVFLKFCRGDYLKFAQKYLYCTVNHVCENKLESYFDELGRRAVSVRKHSRSLACQFLKRDRALEILENAMMTEKNASLRKGLFKIAFHYFLKNPDDQLWELAKQNFAKVNLDDSEAIELLTTYKKVPRAYLKQYILFSWEALKRFPETNKALKEGKGRILEVAATPEFVSELPDEFFREIITGPFMDTLRKPLDHQASASTLICRCLIYVQRDELTDLIFEKLRNFVTEDSLNNRRIQNFVEEFCSEFLKKKCLDQTPLLKFIKMWTDTWPLYQILDQYMHLKFTYIYLNALERSMTIASIAEEVATIWDELYEQNLFVQQVFQVSLQNFKCFFFKVDQEEEDSIENQIIFMETVLKKPSTGRLILAIFLLPYNLENRIFITKYKEIIQVINQNSDPLVQIYLRHYLNRNKEWY